MTNGVERLIARLAGETAERKRPTGLYRLQFHSGFTFADAIRILPYLRELGVSHCYASPVLKARPGSLHGYDITDHHAVNPEIGGETGFEQWVDALRRLGLKQILDTVPNHMGIIGNENAWWNDVLENGPASPYAAYFDIAWYASPRPELHGKVLLPILGESYGQVLESQQIRLIFQAGAFFFQYYDHRLPVAPRTYSRILACSAEELASVADPDGLNEYQSILTAIEHLPRSTEVRPAKIAERQREKEIIKRRLAALTDRHPVIRACIERTVAEFNGRAEDPRSFDKLDQLLEEQTYRLSYWRVADDEINYRRFFDINDLAALSMERSEVFTATHERLLGWLADGRADGLRIDHIDGLYDPKQYLQRLCLQYWLARARLWMETEPEFHGLEWSDVEAAVNALAGSDESRSPPYVVVEKVLGANEALPDDWVTFGTSGYDFLNMINGLFVDASNAQAFTAIYQEFIGDDTSFAELVYQKKYLILQSALSSELHTLAHQLDRLAQKRRWSRDFTFHGLHHALREIIACFPVYRSYITEAGIRDADLKYVQAAVKRAKTKNPAISSSLFDFIRDMLLLQYPDSSDEQDRAEQRRFVGKFQQVGAPVMAKGLEDTAFYAFNRLLSLNEVGGDPARFGLAPGVLQRYLQDRQGRWPFAFSSTSTHDTKRSEDARARLNVLSEMPGEWREALARWSGRNRSHKTDVDDQAAPDANEEYLFYQTLIGAWPAEPMAGGEYADFVTRVHAIMRKALYEAKVHSSWINPNPAYDHAVWEFVARVLHPESNRAFLQDIDAFVRKLNHFGLINSLAQLVLKITAPGVPDVYQGCELWDFGAVDPDNRRPVDFERRRRLLHEVSHSESRESGHGKHIGDWMRHPTDGRIKLYLTRRLLQLRRDVPDLFTIGEYLPLEVAGAKPEHIFAFARRWENYLAITVVPRFVAKLVSAPELPLGPKVWHDTRIILPENAHRSEWKNTLTGAAVSGISENSRETLPLGQVFDRFPMAVLLHEHGIKH